MDPGLGGGTTRLATLAVGASSYHDPFTAPWPATRHQVTAAAPGGARASMDVALGELTLSRLVTLAGSATVLGQGELYVGIARTDAGRVHVAAQGMAGDSSIYRDTRRATGRGSPSPRMERRMPSFLGASPPGSTRPSTTSPRRAAGSPPT